MSLGQKEPILLSLRPKIQPENKRLRLAQQGRLHRLHNRLHNHYYHRRIAHTQSLSERLSETEPAGQHPCRGRLHQILLVLPRQKEPVRMPERTSIQPQDRSLRLAQERPM